MKSKYSHTPFVHLVGLGMPIFMGHLAYRSAVDHFVNGGIVSRILLVAVCVALALLTSWLYLKSGILRFEVTDQALLIKKPWSEKAVPWSAITRIDWNFPLHYVVIRGSTSVHAFSSTDAFPDLLDLLVLIHQHSGCALDSRLERLIKGAE